MNRNTDSEPDTNKTLEILKDVNTKLYIGTEVKTDQTLTKETRKMYHVSASFVYFQDGEIVYTDWTQGKDESDQGEHQKIPHLHICIMLIISF